MHSGGVCVHAQAHTAQTSECGRCTHPVTRVLERTSSSLGQFPSCLFSVSPSVPHSQSAFCTSILNFHSVNHVILPFLIRLCWSRNTDWSLKRIASGEAAWNPVDFAWPETLYKVACCESLNESHVSGWHRTVLSLLQRLGETERAMRWQKGRQAAERSLGTHVGHLVLYVFRDWGAVAL